jgi:hypothetical protein
MLKYSSVEEWRPVPGYEGIYEASNEGRIMRVGPRSDGRHCARTILRPKIQGYARVSLCHNGEVATVLVHRIIAATFLGPCPEGKESNHKDGEKLNNRDTNLEYITHSENHFHRYRVLGHKGHNRVGEAAGRALLSATQVVQIRQAKGTMTHRELAQQFGVSRSTITSVMRRVNWKHI